MALTIRSLRVGLVVALLALVAVLGWYVHFARERAISYIKGLPGKYGLDITNDTVSFSHSMSADTVLTLHAKKQIVHQDGHWTLFDVGIVLYGRKADRSDHIHGNQFEYDPKEGIMRGVGVVYIDLAAPATDADRGTLKGKTKTAAAPPADETKIIHVKTSDVIFSEKEKSATTDAPVEFIASGMTGTSVGASYDSGSGEVVLRSAVHLSGLRNERPTVVTAGRAEFDREGDLVKLESAKAILETDDGARTMAAQHALVHLRDDGSPERVDGQGNVVLTGDGHDQSHGVATGDRMQMDLNPQGQPKTGFLAGNVRLRNDAAARQEDGRGAEAMVDFDATGRPVHSVITGDVEMHIVEGTSDRRLNAAKVVLELGGGGKEPVFLRGALANGSGNDGARLKLVDKSGKDKLSVTASGIRADTLVARFGTAAAGTKVRSGLGPPLVGLDGTGKTYLEQIVTDVKGVVQSKQTSTGDVLKVDFRPGDKGKIELARAEQRGSVVLVREAAVKAPAGKATGAALPKNSDPQLEHARSNVAVYAADDDEMTLTGDVQVQDAESAVLADKVVSDRQSGDSIAEGSVKVTYLQASATGTPTGNTGEPVHVLAARAISHKASGVTEFFANAGGRVKMWQGGSQVEAPVLDLDQNKRTMFAHDVAGSNAAAVKTVIVDANAGTAAEKKDSKQKQGSGPMRVWSQEMTYADATREAEFKGKVRAEDTDGVMTSRDALVYLTQKQAPGPVTAGLTTAGSKTAAADTKATPMMMGGRVDHMVALGAVELDQPGRKATGEKLTYTASDQLFVLTGTKAAPPRMVDDVQGMTTGAALRFRTGDDSVEVSSGEDAATVRSETRMKAKK